MRPDFNKLLTERERIGHGMKFHQVRGSKGNASFDEDAKGGKESIHARRRNSVKVNRKSFNENLNPLRNFLRVSVGRPWDKVYSDICKSFDKRKVVNNHILEHLFQYVEIEDVKVVDGKVYLHSPWRGLKPIKESHCEWYVDPRDGILKSGKRPPKVSLRKLREKQAEKEVAQVFKAIDRDTHLILDGGIWWIYEIKDIPPVVKVWGPQAHMAESIWRTLSKEAKQVEGRWTWKRPSYEALTSGHRDVVAGQDRYYSARHQANHKVLKAMGVTGLMEHDEDAQLTHREANRFRNAA